MIHGDIKPENIVLSQDGHCVITDFGGAVIDFYPQNNIYLEGECRCGIAGLGVFTEAYLAPELLCSYYNNRVYFNEGVDYWAMGVMLHEFVVGRVSASSLELAMGLYLSSPSLMDGS
jgi:serine/threonine protein kinase